MARHGASAHTQDNQEDMTFFLASSPGEERGPVLSRPVASDPARGSTIPSTTGPVGEPGLPPARPVSNSAMNASRMGSSAGPPSRRGVPTLSAGRHGSYHTDSSPPPTAVSRTHVPNVISSAFLRPMSSKRAQQNINDHSVTPTQPLPVARPSIESGRRSHRHRNSNASIVTVEGQQRPLVDPDAPPMPTSRGTGTIARETPSDVNRGSMASSLMPLQGSRSPAPLYLDVDSQTRSSSLQGQKSPKSARSLSASWGRHSRSGRFNEHNTSREGHTKLASAPPSPAAYEPEKELAPAPSENLGKNYEYYNGNAVFFLEGRLINSRQRPLNLLTALLAFLPAILFFIFSAPWLWHNVSPAIPIIFAYIFFVCVSSFLHASFTEPGVIPRNLDSRPPPPQDEDPLAVGPPTSLWVAVLSFAPWEEGQPSAMEVPIKFCKSCETWRPPRAHHCRVCDACVETQDHHCVWLNNCVGRRNYRYFLTFIGSGTIMGLFLLGASLAHILLWMVRHDTTFSHSINVWRVPFAMFIYSLIIIPYPASLWAYHIYLTGRGETTREYLNTHKFQKPDRYRPYSQHSILKNWVSVLLRPRPPTYMRFKGPYEQGDRQLGGTTKVQAKQKRTGSCQEKDAALEMKQMNGSSRGSSRGFQGPRGRGPMINMNNTPRGDGDGSPKL